jgi:hypothetical protein
MRRRCSSHAKGAQRCRDRGDRGCLVRVHGPHQERARRAQQVSATPKRVVSIVIGRSAPRPPLALEVPPTLLARAGEVIEMELSCAVRPSGARAPWTGGVMSLTQRAASLLMRRLGVSDSRCNELERIGQQLVTKRRIQIGRVRRLNISRRIRTKGQL